jgi:hypothetical protein
VSSIVVDPRRAAAPAAQPDPGRRPPGSQQRLPASAVFSRALLQATAAPHPAGAAAGAAGRRPAADSRPAAADADVAVGAGAAAAAMLRRHVKADRRQAGLRVTVTAPEEQPATAAAAGGAAAGPPSILARLSHPAQPAAASMAAAEPLGSPTPRSQPLSPAGPAGEAQALGGQPGTGGLQADHEALRLRMRRMELELTRLRAESSDASKASDGVAATAAKIR